MLSNGANALVAQWAHSTATAVLIIGTLLMIADSFFAMAHEFGAWLVGCLFCIGYSATAIREDERINKNLKRWLYAYLAIVFVFAVLFDDFQIYAHQCIPTDSFVTIQAAHALVLPASAAHARCGRKNGGRLKGGCGWRDGRRVRTDCQGDGDPAFQCVVAEAVAVVPVGQLDPYQKAAGRLGGAGAGGEGAVDQAAQAVDLGGVDAQPSPCCAPAPGSRGRRRAPRRETPVAPARR